MHFLRVVNLARHTPSAALRAACHTARKATRATSALLIGGEASLHIRASAFLHPPTHAVCRAEIPKNQHCTCQSNQRKRNQSDSPVVLLLRPSSRAQPRRRCTLELPMLEPDQVEMPIMANYSARGDSPLVPTRRRRHDDVVR